jgi:kanamycin kinase
MKRTPVQVNIDDWPDELAGFLQGAAVFDSSCSPEAKVLFIDRDGGLFLKTAGAGTLKTEARMTAFLHTLGLSAEVLYYGTRDGKDRLLTRRIPGEDCTHPQYLSEPERLCDTTAGLLRQLHERNGQGCPVPDRIRTYTETVRNGFNGSHYEPDLFRGLWEFASFEEAKRAAEEGMPLLKKDVLLHGDYCLPNVILDDWRFSGFIDLGNGGIGDRHIDILWGVWTLNFNLKTTKYTGRFLDAYGRDRIEPEMLRMVAAMEMIGG